MNLTGKQIALIVSAVLGALTTSTAQLTDLFGSEIARYIISFAGLCNTVLSIVVATISGQSSIILDAQGMKGVEKIIVNKDANSTLASLAVDPANAKIEASPSAQAAVNQTARNG